MSNVVAFRPERTGRPVVRRDGEEVAILFFTGIRYVRDDPPADPTGPEPQPVAPATAEGCEDFATERLKA